MKYYLNWNNKALQNNSYYSNQIQTNNKNRGWTKQLKILHI